jgi:hypothetical protein
MPFRSLWSVPLQAGASGVALAREAGTVLAWDRTHWLYLLSPTGQRQAQRRFAGALKAACGADDGSAYAAVGAGGEVWWLAPDLMTRWETKLPQPALTAALDPFGQYLAVADAVGGLHLFDCLGRPAGQAESPRPLHYLSFVPAAPFLVGCADYGLAAAFDVTGKLLWRVGLVAHAGGLAVSGEGEQVVLACFTEGLLRYGPTGQPLSRLAVAEPCRLVSVTFAGRRFLVGGMGGQLLLLDEGGRTLATHSLEQPAAALALGALGHDAVVALADGPVVRLEIAPSSAK